MVLAQKQTYRSMKQNRNPRSKPTHLIGQLIYNKEARIYNREKTIFSASGTGKTGQLHIKGWNWNIL